MRSVMEDNLMKVILKYSVQWYLSKPLEDSQNLKIGVSACCLWDMKPDQKPTDAFISAEM